MIPRFTDRFPHRFTDPQPATPPRRPVFVSPHLDDAAFSCGRLLASFPDAVVATVFAGKPPPGQALTEWDRAAGFGNGDDVVAQRREEDRQALARFDAWPVWLDFPDSQYGEAPAIEELAAEMHRLFRQCEADAVFFPLGLFHSDHRLTRQATLAFARSCSGCDWYAYEDALYRRLAGWREEALADLKAKGLAMRPVVFAEADGAALRKQEAIACYASQLRALERPGMPPLDDLQAPEAYWRVAAGGAAS